jgi:hypothetical protein
LHFGEVYYLIHGWEHTLPLPVSVQLTVPKLLAVVHRHGPKVARTLLDDVLDDRREKRKRPAAERNATWKRWHEEDNIGPTKIARRWREQTGEEVEPNTVKQALRRTR